MSSFGATVMQEIILCEVGKPLHLDVESISDWGNELFGLLYSSNDDKYKEYTRLLRRYDRMAWQHHDCSYCKEPISSGDWYEAYVYVSKSPEKKSCVWVEKRHYPECPERLRDYEEEMRREWEKEDRAREESAKKAA